MKRYALVLLCAALWPSLGCGRSVPPPPPLNEETRSEIEREDAEVYEGESQN